MDILLDLGLVTIIAVAAGWGLGRAGITRNLAYMVAGVIAGIVLRPVIQPTLVASFDIVTAAALGFVTFGIGEDFTAASLRHMGARGPPSPSCRHWSPSCSSALGPSSWGRQAPFTWTTFYPRRWFWRQQQRRRPQRRRSRSSGVSGRTVLSRRRQAWP